MGNKEIVNGRIKSTTLGIEDHGILTFFLQLEWGAGGQGLGGYALDRSERSGEREGFGAGLIAIRYILDTVGVSKWEDLPGKFIHIQHYGWGSTKPPIIGHIIEDKWFDLGEFIAVENRKLKVETQS